jgi:hypothetical protein
MPATASTHDLRHFIRVYDDSLDAGFCKRVIDLFEGLPQHQIPRQRSYGPEGRETAWHWTQMHADSTPAAKPIEARLREIGTGFAHRYAKDVGYSLFPFEFEELKIKRYNPGANECFPPHVDITHAGTMHRMVAMLWYLNDVAQGGETYFGSLDYRVEPRRGRLVMFPPNWMYPHAGMPSRSNPKYIAGTYLKYRAVSGQAQAASGAASDAPID